MLCYFLGRVSTGCTLMFQSCSSKQDGTCLYVFSWSNSVVAVEVRIQKNLLAFFFSNIKKEGVKKEYWYKSYLKQLFYCLKKKNKNTLLPSWLSSSPRDRCMFTPTVQNLLEHLSCKLFVKQLSWFEAVLWSLCWGWMFRNLYISEKYYGFCKAGRAEKGRMLGVLRTAHSCDRLDMMRR